MATTKFKRFGLPAALVVGGVTAGSLLAPIGLASAQESDTDADDSATTSSADEQVETDAETDSDTESDTARDGRRGRGHFRGGQKLEALTDTLGLSAEEIRQGFEDGKSLADLAEEQGVDVEEVKTVLVDAATERVEAAVEAGRLDSEEAAEKLAEIETEIDERIDTVPDLSERRGSKMGRGMEGRLGRGHGMRGGGVGLETLEETLGLTGEQIRAELESGKTLAEIGEAQGVSVEQLADQLVADMQQRLDQAVEDGKIDQERADEVAENLGDNVEERLNSEFDGSRKGRGFSGGRSDSAAPMVDA